MEVFSGLERITHYIDRIPPMSREAFLNSVEARQGKEGRKRVEALMPAEQTSITPRQGFGYLAEYLDSLQEGSMLPSRPLNLRYT